MVPLHTAVRRRGVNDETDGTSQSLRALLRLRELLLAGEFKAGSRMSELPLVDRLGVSRTPLRLALATLEHEGLLELLPRGGYAVRKFTESDIADAVELRGVLEGTAARMAAERGASPEILGELNTCNEAMEPMVHRADWESFEAYVGAQRALPRAVPRRRPEPDARARDRRRRVVAVRVGQRVRAGRGRAARVARDPRRRPLPAPALVDAITRREGCARRKHRARARAPGVAQPRGRVRPPPRARGDAGRVADHA